MELFEKSIELAIQHRNYTVSNVIFVVKPSILLTALYFFV